MGPFWPFLAGLARTLAFRRSGQTSLRKLGVAVDQVWGPAGGFWRL